MYWWYIPATIQVGITGRLYRTTRLIDNVKKVQKLVGRYDLIKSFEENLKKKDEEKLPISFSIEPIEVQITFDPRFSHWKVKVRKFSSNDNEWVFIKENFEELYFCTLKRAQKWCIKRGLTTKNNN
jgi:hypothetical protein